MDRDTVVAALGKAPSWLSYDISKPQLIHTGPESAALVSRAGAEGKFWTMSQQSAVA
jgi:hypothetical protein